MAESFAPKSREDMVQDKMNELGAPEHEDALRAIRTKTMVHEMMTSDSIISGYPYADVLDAFNHLSEVAPRAMQQRVMAQALIRKYLEQAAALDPFDVDQLLGVEGKISERDMPATLAKGNYLAGPMRELGPAPVRKPEVEQPQGIGAQLSEYYGGISEGLQEGRADRATGLAEGSKQRGDFKTKLRQEEKSMRMKDRVKKELEPPKPVTT